jgi:hypothetical protein
VQAAISAPVTHGVVRLGLTSRRGIKPRQGSAATGGTPGGGAPAVPSDATRAPLHRVRIEPPLRIEPIGEEGWREMRRQDLALLRLCAGGLGLLLLLACI